MPVTRDTTLDWMRRFAGEMDEHRQELVRLDTAIGDGDHGTNMDRGMRKALEKLDGAEQDDPGRRAQDRRDGVGLERGRRRGAPLRDAVPADGRGNGRPG